ncbi:sulfur oxidation c-type cytochrome SoxX [Sulfuriflexus sp.]|uniref:sulfur oxidation c-type cytochrome SoxX n=1 Tax=Sulfuriflexus sp. TaxID=2015443 RepID=UPI0028CEBBE4|nr:sulfur oxidation c-type cytochrome SoxX [Sulfuriflexus sp.]MDT8404272.1 sulfur oxidation c-type cytochrome SoxX [Sulfuriflexus sp.]
MRNVAKKIATASAIAVLMGSFTLAPQAVSAKEMTSAEAGKKVAENRKKGNCFACHAYEGAAMAGNIGPPLVAMKARFPDRNKLRQQVSDPESNNPDTLMIPFGKHGVLSEKEIENVIDWLYTL